MPTPQDTREIDPKLRAEIEAVYAAIDDHSAVDAYAEPVDQFKIKPFMKSLKADAVVELTAEAKAQSYDPDRLYQNEISQAMAYTQYINDLRDNRLGKRNG